MVHSLPLSWRFRLSIALSLVGLLAPFASSFGQPDAASNERGYHNCNLHHLEACQNTNQMFVGLRGPGWSHEFGKPELPSAIKNFLRGAPRIDTLGHSFSASAVVEESLTGPGDRYRFPTAEWFFTGFAPHDAPDQAAIIFDAAGHILLIATQGPDMTVAPKGAYGGYPQNLTIYMHTPQPDDKFIQRIIQWARDAVAERNKTYPALPSDKMGPIRIVTASKDQRKWNIRLLE
jgi:hypothetical protein